MCKILYNQRGQIIFEILWLLFFTSAFLMMVSYLHDSGKKEIHLSRLK